MKRIVTLSIGICLLLLASICFAQMYTVTDVGTLPSRYPDSLGTAVSNSGEVVGYSTAGFSQQPWLNFYHPFSYKNGVMHDLGTLPLPGGDTPASAVALDVNDSGEVVGYASYGFPITCCHAFLYSNGTMQDLVTLRSDGASQALGINKSGVVVGESDGPGDYYRDYYSHPILYDGAMHDLGVPPGFSSATAFAINASGQIVVTAYPLSLSYSHVFLYSGGQYQDIGTPVGGPWVTATDLNDHGEIVGNVRSTSNAYPFLYTNGAIQELPLPAGYIDGFATKINNSGEIVGYARPKGALLWENGTVLDLNTLVPPNSGWSLEQANAINDTGQIVVQGLRNGEYHALLLNPIYKAFVQAPNREEGGSIFKANRGVLPVKFTLSQYDVPTCTLPRATIAVTRTAGGTLGPVANGTFSRTGCQYHYNLAASALGIGTYQLDISINGIMVGHAVFALK
jgi:probable HAF family extracellular repeat protein